MPIYKFSNFAASTLQSALTTTTTSIIVSSADSAKFPAIVGGEGFYITLWDRVHSPEIVEVTAFSGQTMTVIRASEGTAAYAWQAGTPVRLAMTKALLESIRATSLTTVLTSPTSGQFLKYNGTSWINSAIAESDVTNLVTDLAAINTTLTTHTHTAVQVAGGTPTFTTVLGAGAVALAASTDLNGISAVGAYKVSTPVNGPSGSGNWLIAVVQYDASTAMQVGTEVSGIDNQQWIRRKIAGAWAAWGRLPTDATMTAAIAAGISNNYVIAAGLANAITLDFIPDLTIVDGTEIKVRHSLASTGTAPTISVDLGTARTVTLADASTLHDGAIGIGDHSYRWNATALTWLLLNPVKMAKLGAVNNFTKSQNQAKMVAIASAGTTDIWTPADGNYAHITGVTTITSLGTAPQAGAERTVVFDNILTLTHNATSLILPGGANITTAAGDSMVVRADTTANMKVTTYTKASGLAIVNPWTELTKLTDSSIVSNITLANDADLQFAVTSGLKYEVDIVFHMAAGAGGIRVGITGPTNSRFGAEYFAANSLGAAHTNITAYGQLDTAAVTFENVMLKISFTASASGTFAVQAAQNTSSVVATGITTGSYLRYRSF